MTIRPKESADWQTIYMIYVAAFEQSAESDLVQRMHKDGDLILSLIAYNDHPAGHIAYSHLRLHEAPSIKACVLAPLAVSSRRSDTPKRCCSSMTTRPSLR